MSEPNRTYAPTKAGIAAMRQHDALVNAVHEAIYSLESPFDANDEKPGAIQDAIDILKAGLSRSTR